MPSPFPGVDPYLEGAEWSSVHTELSAEIARQLAPKLRPKYVVRTTRRFVTEMVSEVAIVGSNIYPDVSVVDTRRQGTIAPGTSATVSIPLELATVIPAQIPLVTVEIQDVARRQLITAIEVLSPTNKRGQGYQEYLDKRGRILHSTAHLIEIDLLRQGQRAPRQQPLPQAPYFVFVSRAERRPILEVWPIQLNMPLPVITVPLQAEDAEVTLDLGLALNTIYDTLNYDLIIDYSQPPQPPLEGDEAIWASELLREAGIGSS
jgi:hypothetical protein